MSTRFLRPPLPASTHPPVVWVVWMHPPASRSSPASRKYPVMFGPNITGYTSGILFGSESEFVGAFLRQGESVNAKDPTGSWNHHYQTVGLDGSRVDSAFGKASSVQPAALRLLPCIKF